ncbi:MULTISPECIES: hypothetical protein [Streptomyces]|uniref:hypothetical protein n=1 Tax=Streptomyces TaxID=1883 RepID=UPI001E3AB140|nr:MULTISPECIES: hypothetical protein [Streptomyces]
MHTRTVTRCLVTALALGLAAVTATGASAAPRDEPGPQAAPKTVELAGGKGLRIEAAAEGRSLVESRVEVAAAAANVCGAGYTISTGAARYGTYGTAYTWTNGTTTGSSYYDKPICAVFFNDTGTAHYMGVRLKDNYTATPDTQDFGTFGSYAGPVYQNRGYCGQAYSYMEVGGKAVVDNYLQVGACN